MTNIEKSIEVAQKYCTPRISCLNDIAHACYEMAEWKDKQLADYRERVIAAATAFFCDIETKYYSIDDVKEKFIEIINSIKAEDAMDNH